MTRIWACTLGSTPCDLSVRSQWMYFGSADLSVYMVLQAIVYVLNGILTFVSINNEKLNCRKHLNLVRIKFVKLTIC